MSRDFQSIRDMWNAAQEILSFTVDMDYDSLKSDRRTQAAVHQDIPELMTLLQPLLLNEQDENSEERYF
jgi:uncharacterized protein with HEPN domain